MKKTLYMTLIFLVASCAQKPVVRNYKMEELVHIDARNWIKTTLTDEGGSNRCILDQHNMQVQLTKKQKSKRINYHIMFGAWDPKGHHVVMEVNGNTYKTDHMVFAKKDIKAIINDFKLAKHAYLKWHSKQNMTIKTFTIFLSDFSSKLESCIDYIRQDKKSI